MEASTIHTFSSVLELGSSRCLHVHTCLEGDVDVHTQPRAASTSPVMRITRASAVSPAPLSSPTWAKPGVQHKHDPKPCSSAPVSPCRRRGTVPTVRMHQQRRMGTCTVPRQCTLRRGSIR